MKGEWLNGGYVISGRTHLKCSNCGQMQMLSLFENGMRFCSTCGDRKYTIRNTLTNKPKQSIDL